MIIVIIGVSIIVKIQYFIGDSELIYHKVFIVTQILVALEIID